MKKRIKLLLKILVSILLFVIILSNVNKDELLANIKLLNFSFVPLVFLLLFLNYLVSSVRWKYLLSSECFSKVSISYLTRLYFVGSFFNNFMPTSIGGDVYKVYKLSKKIGDSAQAFSATFMERFTGVLVLLLISVFGMVDVYGTLFLLLIPLFVLGFITLIYLLKFASKKFKKLLGIYESLVAYRNRPYVLVVALITSLFVQIFAIFTQYFIFLAIGVKPPLFYAFFVLPLITLASFFIPSLNGLGVQDALYIQLFSVVGISSSTAFSASILYHLFRLVVSLVGGIIYALGKDE